MSFLRLSADLPTLDEHERMCLNCRVDHRQSEYMSFAFQERRSDSPLVEKIWHTRSEQVEPFTSTASAHWEMVVVKYQGNVTLHLRGPETMATPMECPPDAEFFAIDF